MSVTTDNCKLCNQVAEIKKSHVFPKSLWDDMQPVQMEARKGVQTKWKRPGGCYERLLCSRCEDIIGCYEDYGIPLLKEIKLNGLTSCASFDFRKWRLFCLSLFWRSSVAKEPPYKQSYLPPDVLECLRKALLNGDLSEFPDNAFPVKVIRGKKDSPTSSFAHIPPFPVKNTASSDKLIVSYFFGFCFLLYPGACQPNTLSFEWFREEFSSDILVISLLADDFNDILLEALIAAYDRSVLERVVKSK